MPFKGVRTLTPVAPSKVIAVGLNYADHARESGKPLPNEPLFWLKAPTSLIPDGGKVEIPFPAHRTDFEAELAIVIGRRMRNVTPAAAARYIFGYTAPQDISDRTIQNAESQWARCKSFDTFTPLGPYVETKIDPHDLTIQLFQNGQLRQNSNTSQLIFNCFHLVSFISTNMTLLPGRHDPDRHAQRRRPDRIGRPAGSPHPGLGAAGQYREVDSAQSRISAARYPDVIRNSVRHSNYLTMRWTQTLHSHSQRNARRRGDHLASTAAARRAWSAS